MASGILYLLRIFHRLYEGRAFKYKRTANANALSGLVLSMRFRDQQRSLCDQSGKMKRQQRVET